MKIKCNWTGELIEASPWNGEHEGLKYPFEGCEEYMQATDGTIYYKHGDGYNIWCCTSELRKHLIRLNQIARWPIREPVLVPAERKVTQKIVKAGHQHVLSVGYCALQFLLRAREANYYTTRAEGWAADVYSVGTVAIATGYKPFGDIDPSYELCRLYNGKAQDIWNNHSLEYEEKKEKIDQLLNEFIKMAVKESKKE